VTPAFSSLMPLLDATGVRPSTLAQRAGITKQAISQLVRELETRGYVGQVPDSTDTRAKIVRLTKRGVTTNLKGTFFTVQTLLPVLRDGASVILTSSLAATKGLPAFSVYSATKVAIRSLARTLTTDLKGRRILVNALSPGHTYTPLGKNAGLPQERLGAYFERMALETPLGRTGEPDDSGGRSLPRIRRQRVRDGDRTSRRRRQRAGLRPARAPLESTRSNSHCLAR